MFKSKARIFLSILLVFAIILTLAGCGNKVNKANTDNNSVDKTIVIWAYDYYIDAAKAAVELYKIDHPNAKFDIVELGQDDLVQKFNLALASGNKEGLPDIVCEEDYNLKGYLAYYENSFVDLTNYIDPNLYVDFKVRDCTYNGKIWGIPYDTGVSAWFYRIDIIKDAGYSEDDLKNITWDDFIKIGKVVYEKTGKYMIPLSPEGNIEGRIILQSANSWYYNAEGMLNIVNNQALNNMTETIKKIYTAGVVDKVASWDDIIASFYNSNSAGVIGGSWWASIIAKNENQSGLWRVTQVPRMSGSDKYTNYGCCGGCSWLVLNTEKKVEAIDFLMNTVAVSDDIANTMVEKGYVVPALKTAFSVPNAVAGDVYFGGQNLCEIMASWGEYVPYANYYTNSYEIAYAHGVLFPDYLRGITTVDTVISTLQTKAEEIMSK